MPRHGTLVVVGLLALLTVAAFGFINPAYASSTTTATFSGTSRMHVVVRFLTNGAIANMHIPSTFSVTLTPGGPGVGTIALTVIFSFGGKTIAFAADGGAHDPVGTGQILVSSAEANGGGTLFNPATGYMSQFGFGVTANSGGQFQCQNTGRSASVMDGPLSMLFGTPVDVLQMDVHGTVAAGNLVVG